MVVKSRSQRGKSILEIEVSSPLIMLMVKVMRVISILKRSAILASLVPHLSQLHQLLKLPIDRVYPVLLVDKVMEEKLPSILKIEASYLSLTEVLLVMKSANRQ